MKNGALPTLMGRSSASLGESKVDTAQLDRAATGSTSSAASSSDEKLRDIFSTLNALISRPEGSDDLYGVVQQLGTELPAADLKKLQWSMGVLGYHVLGDRSKRPSGLALAPAIRRSVSSPSSSASLQVDSAS